MNKQSVALYQYALEFAYENVGKEDSDKPYFQAIVAGKFAELIVRECIEQCEQVATAADAKSKSKFVTNAGRMLHEGMWGGAKNCSGQIKQHFGVE